MRRLRVSQSVDETSSVAIAIGQRLLHETAAGHVIALQGSVGVGKSEFARSLIRAMCDDEELVVTSPTFTLLNSYELDMSMHGRSIHVHHLDLYRLKSISDLAVLELDVLHARGEHLIVEWPDLLLENGSLKWPHVIVDIELGENENSRLISLSGKCGGESIISQLQ